MTIGQGTAAAGLGVLATVAAHALGLPGHGEWIIACWTLGAVAALIRPSWQCLATAAAGVVGGFALIGAIVGLTGGGL